MRNGKTARPKPHTKAGRDRNTSDSVTGIKYSMEVASSSEKINSANGSPQLRAISNLPLRGEIRRIEHVLMSCGYHSIAYPLSGKRRAIRNTFALVIIGDK